MHVAAPIATQNLDRLDESGEEPPVPQSSHGAPATGEETLWPAHGARETSAGTTRHARRTPTPFSKVPPTRLARASGTDTVPVDDEPDTLNRYRRFMRRGFPGFTFVPPVLTVHNITARYRDCGHDTLQGAGFSLEPGGLLAVIGPSGGGKSTLCKAIVGDVGITGGDVRLVAGATNPSSLVSYVPQVEAMVSDLTVGDALRFVARLRAPTGTSTDEHRSHVAEVLHQLRLTEQEHQMVASLSGGQKKRVSIAMELLSQPLLLIMDEPTSGLDEGLDRALMALLRDLPDVTCLVVTHSTVNLDLATQCLAIAYDGDIAYDGPPSGLQAWFSADSFSEVMDALREVDATPAHDTSRARPRRALPPPPTVRSLSVLWQRQLRRWWPRSSNHGAWWRVMRDQRLIHLLWVPLAVAFATWLTGPEGLSGTAAAPRERLGATLNLLNFVAAFFAMSLTAPVLVDDFPIVKRERRWGIGTNASIMARALLLLPIAFVQACLAVTIYLALRPGSQTPLHLPVPEVLFFALILGLVNVAAACLGLMISALSSTTERATQGIMGAAALQVLLSGVVVPFGRNASTLDAAMSWASYLVPTRWGVAAMAAITDMQNSNPGTTDAMWNADGAHVLWPLGALALLSATFLGLAMWAVYRRVKALE